MKTAVEWLIEQMKTYNMTVSVHNTSHQNVMDFYKAIEQAKEMEKQQIIDAADWNVTEWQLHNGEQYYNETFNKKEDETAS
jgi:sulfatase maturation enzyme AslB (radical SAM superfamily)